MHTWRLGDWLAAQGHTPEVCLLLRVGASEMTPWSPGAGLGVAEHQGAPPMQQGPWSQSPGLVGRGRWDQSQGDCSFSVYFLKFFLLIIIIVIIFTNRNTSLFHFYFLFHVIVLSFSF